MSRKFILHNNNAKKLLTISKKKFNKQSDYLFFFILNYFIDISKSIWIFNFFLRFRKYRLKNIQGYNRATVSSNREILGWHMESYYKTIPKIRNITFIFRNFEKKFQT